MRVHHATLYDQPLKPAGSGGTESSNKFISNVRLKRSGAWWYPTNANNILKLRCAKYNGTFDRIMAEAKRKNKPIYSQKKLGKLRLVVNNSWEIGNAPVKLAPAIIAAWSGILVLGGASTQIAWLAIISGVVFGPERCAAGHTKAAKDYTVMKHEARSLHEAFFPEMSQSEFYIAVRILREKYNSLVAHTPKTSNRAFKIAQERIKQGRHTWLQRLLNRLKIEC